MTTPMLADFAIRLADGLAILLLATNWKLVPIGFFRTHCLVILGLLVLASLQLVQSGGFGTAAFWLTASGAVLAYLATALWGLGLPTVAWPATALLVAAASGTLAIFSQGGTTELVVINWLGRMSSAFVLGATLTAMLLGHYYLTAPAMSIDPLRRFVAAMAIGLGIRAAIGVVGYLILQNQPPAESSADLPVLFVAMRWGMGILGPAVATFLTWRTVLIRSTQSATGILYIAMTLLLFGELSALILSASARIIL